MKSRKQLIASLGAIAFALEVLDLDIALAGKTAGDNV